MSTMNERIKNRRREIGITQKELADILSISDKTVSRWESGNQLPDTLLLPVLADALSISINELYGISPSEHAPLPDVPKPRPKTGMLLIYKILMIFGIVAVCICMLFLVKINVFSAGEFNEAFVMHNVFSR